jgi:hypothetical protein
LDRGFIASTSISADEQFPKKIAMYHYLGSFQLYETSRSINSYRNRCPCKIDNAYYDSIIEIINQSELAPSKSVEVQISFLSIDLIAPLIKVGGVYQVCEGSRPIGDVLILHDPWDKFEQWITEGEIRKALVGQIDWTTA